MSDSYDDLIRRSEQRAQGARPKVPLDAPPPTTEALLLVEVRAMRAQVSRIHWTLLSLGLFIMVAFVLVWFGGVGFRVTIQ